MKIVVIGAGSESFGTGTVVDILTSKDLLGRGVTLSLVDVEAAKLRLMASLARRIKAATKSDIRIQSSTDRCEALAGARYVITSVACKRYELWEQDYRIPQAYGFKHVLGENGGPGALFHALRSLKLVMPICRDIERCCPDALLLNFTNPEARILHAILTLTRVKAIGICHGVFGAMKAISDYLKRPLDELQIVSAGMNHFYCVLKAVDKKTGKDLLGKALKAAIADKQGKFGPPLFRKLAEVFGVFTFPSDDHIGEYLSYGWEATRNKWIYGQEHRKVTLQPPAPSRVREYAEGERPIDRELLRPSGEITVPVICDIEMNRRSYRNAVNVLNTDGYIENLPRTAAVEVPAWVDGKGVHPVAVGAIPETFAACMRTQFTIIDLVTRAFQTGRKKLLLQALLLDPCVNSLSGAEKMLEEMLDLQAEFLPTFK